MKKGMKKLATTLLAALLMITQFPAVESKAATSIGMSGKAHVQSYGDTNGRITYENGIETLVLGTRGQAKRVESITVNLQNNTGYIGTIQYRVHRQTYGWTDWTTSGQPAGTTGQGKRLEAMQIRLTGELANHYDVRYRVHIQTYGDNQGWVYNGALAGTTGEAKRLEEVKIQIIPKNTASETPSINYRVHRQTYGWETTWAKDGAVSGTTGQGKRLEGISIDIKGTSYSGSVEYQTHVQSYGWMNWVADGAMSGTSGQAKRLEAIRIRLTGELANHYDIYYRVHAQSLGWMGWAKNGEAAGTARYAKRLEAIQIVLCRKGTAPGANVAGIVPATSDSYKDALNPTPTTPTTPTVPTVPTTPTVPQNPTLQPALTQTVTYYQCDYCKKIFQTNENLQQHFQTNVENKKCGVISKCADGNGGAKTQTFTIRDAYYSNQAVPATRTVTWVQKEAAFSWEAEQYEEVPYRYCGKCNKRFYAGKNQQETEDSGGVAKDGEYFWNHYYAGCLTGGIDGHTEKRLLGHVTLIEPAHGYYEVR